MSPRKPRRLDPGHPAECGGNLRNRRGGGRARHTFVYCHPERNGSLAATLGHFQRHPSGHFALHALAWPVPLRPRRFDRRRTVLSRFSTAKDPVSGRWAPAVNAALHSVCHFYTPWNYLVFFLAFLPLAYYVRLRGNLLPTIITHILFNSVGIILVLAGMRLPFNN